jgi:hypothetical protein
MVIRLAALRHCNITTEEDFGGEFQFQKSYKSTSAEMSAALTTDLEFDHRERVRAAGECC